MKTKSKTFKEGDDIEEAMLFSQGFIWDENVEITGENKDEYFLKHKVQIIVKIFNNPKP